MNAWRWLTSVQHADEDQQRLGRNVIWVALAMFVLGLAFVPVAVLQPRPVGALLAIALGNSSFLVAIALARQGRVYLAAWLVVGMTLVAIISALWNTASYQAAFYLVLPVMLAGVVLPARQIWIALALAESGLWATVMLSGHPLTNLMERQAVLGGALLMVMVALLSFLGARGTTQALANARLARDAARRAWASLAEANAELEARIAARTAELSTALAQQQAQATALAESLAIQQRLHETIAQLSLPVLPIRDDTLVAPLVGVLDADRATRLLSQVLQAIEARRARFLVLDVTGLANVDAQVAATLLQTAGAARLLGAEPLLVGIRPEVAQALAALDVTLGGLHTAATLEQGLALCDSLAAQAARGVRRVAAA